jgi:glycosyltransferase involved in cell wall biosynthesis
MNLCQIVPSLEERHGGPSKSTRELSAALARQGQNVSLLATSPDSGGAMREGSLDIRTYARSWPPQFCASRALQHSLKAVSADIVHHHALWLRTLDYAHRCATRLRVPLVISPRGMMNSWAWQHRRWKKWLAQYLIHPGAFRGAAGWHATSEEEAADIRALGFGQPIVVAPNGIAVPSTSSLTEAADYWHRLCPSSASRPTAVFYSRFHRKKRLLELIDCWLAQAPPDWLLLVAGIPQEYSVEHLEEYVLRSSGGGRIEIHDGLGRPAPYAVASLFVLPTHSENFGLAIAEALAAGVPVLVTDGAPWQRINAEGIGWCVPWREFPGVLRGALSEGPERLRLRGALGRTWIEREYSWDPAAGRLLDFYQTLRTSHV